MPYKKRPPNPKSLPFWSMYSRAEGVQEIRKMKYVKHVQSISQQPFSPWCRHPDTPLPALEALGLRACPRARSVWTGGRPGISGNSPQPTDRKLLVKYPSNLDSQVG